MGAYEGSGVKVLSKGVNIPQGAADPRDRRGPQQLRVQSFQNRGRFEHM